MEEYAIQIPKNILKFMNENPTMFRGSIAPEDVIEKLCCFETEQNQVIMYKANINNVITWVIDEDTTKMWVNNSLIFIDVNPYKLSFLDL